MGVIDQCPPQVVRGMLRAALSSRDHRTCSTRFIHHKLSGGKYQPIDFRLIVETGGGARRRLQPSRLLNGAEGIRGPALRNRRLRPRRELSTSAVSVNVVDFETRCPSVCVHLPVIKSV